MSQTHNDSINVPQTITPVEVHIGNIALLFVSWLMLVTLFSPDFDHERIWAGILVMVELGVMITSGAMAVELPDRHGSTIFDPLTKERRSVFQGFHFKNPWEKLETLEDLRREAHSGGRINLPTNDPSETMELDLLIHTRVETSGSPEEAAESMKRFKSTTEDARKAVIDGEVTKMLAAHYASKGAKGEMENLTDARAIQKAVLEDDAINRGRLHELGHQYGVHIGVVLKSSNPDERTKKLKEAPARAEALRLARHNLMKKGDGGEEGMGGEEASRAALLLDGGAEYSEHRLALDVDVNAPDLHNLRDINIIPPGSLSGGSQKGGKKK